MLPGYAPVNILAGYIAFSRQQMAKCYGKKDVALRRYKPVSPIDFFQVKKASLFALNTRPSTVFVQFKMLVAFIVSS